MNDKTDPSILVWDAPVRVFHWLMVLSFAGAWLTAESERWRLMHVTLGYTMAGLLVFRVLWGVLGTRHARFADFVRGPREVGHYLASLLRGRPEHHVGHNPAGALSVLAILTLTGITAALGWATYSELGGDCLEDAHETAATLMLVVVGVHVAGVIVSSLLLRENLVRAMLTGRKPGPAGQGIRRALTSLAALMLATVLGFWGWQWATAPNASSAVAQAARHQEHDDGD